MNKYNSDIIHVDKWQYNLCSCLFNKNTVSLCSTFIDLQVIYKMYIKLAARADYVLYRLHDTPAHPSDSHLWHCNIVFDTKSIIWMSLKASVPLHKSVIDKLPAVNQDQESKLRGKMAI